MWEGSGWQHAGKGCETEKRAGEDWKWGCRGEMGLGMRGEELAVDILGKSLGVGMRGGRKTNMWVRVEVDMRGRVYLDILKG